MVRTSLLDRMIDSITPEDRERTRIKMLKEIGEYMQHEILYKRAKKGNIQYWKITVTDNVILKESGKLGTKNPLVHKEAVKGVNIGKSNETTPQEQAELQALSNWKKKHDEGYKSLDDLDINPDIDLDYAAGVSMINLAMALEQALPQFNTDASGNEKPMLAPTKPWKAGPKNGYPKLADIKYDGNRAQLILDPEYTKILSRSGKEITTMYRILNRVEADYPLEDRKQRIIIDGELYYHGLLLEEINEAVKKESENTHLIQFYAFDLPLSKESQEVRSEILELHVNTFLKNPLIVYIPPVLVYSDAEVQTLHDKRVKEEEYEGLILKDPAGYYQPGQRSSFWEKVKMFDETEFTIIGYKLGQRGAQDLNFVCLCNDGQDTFEAPMNGSLPLKLRLYERIDDLIGQQLTVTHFGYSKYNIPNLPRGKAIREPGS